MSRISPTSAGVFRRALAVLVTAGQILGTIGIIPVRADPGSEDPTPYPCKNHRCGCHSYDECWGSTCCCYTMREKVVWAREHGLSPPEHAERLAADEEQAACQASDEVELPCCAHRTPSRRTDEADESVHPRPSCCAGSSPPAHQEDRPVVRNKNRTSAGGGSAPGVTWVAGFYAQKCHGPGPDGLGLLNVGVEPTVAQLPLNDPAPLHNCELVDLTPVFIITRPPLPPPRA